jgi:hypothetical protein
MESASTSVLLAFFVAGVRTLDIFRNRRYNDGK